ncbi:hypothetical protein TNCV_1419521 [Trichonephila clavipes]|nr:hypothetical protein TNCV_1419521 [Trichonephila clavipes]
MSPPGDKTSISEAMYLMDCSRATVLSTILIENGETTSRRPVNREDSGDWRALYISRTTSIPFLRRNMKY